MNEVVIVSAVRTPVGNFGGSLRTVPAYDLGALILNEVVKRAEIKTDLVNMVIMGQNYHGGEYVNIARMSLLKADWPVEIPALTFDRRCPSGFDAVCLATMMIQSGNADIVAAGGVESMSTAEFYIKGDVRWGVGGTGDMPKGHGSLSTWGMPMYDRILRSRVMSQPEERFGDDLGRNSRQGIWYHQRSSRQMGSTRQPKGLCRYSIRKIQGRNRSCSGSAA